MQVLQETKGVDEDYESRLHQICKQCKAAEATAKEQRKCSSCKKTKGVDDFRDTRGRGKKNELSKHCRQCEAPNCTSCGDPYKGKRLLKLVPVRSISVRSLTVTSG